MKGRRGLINLILSMFIRGGSAERKMPRQAWSGLESSVGAATTTEGFVECTGTIEAVQRGLSE